jgi:hypothetical protein
LVADRTRPPQKSKKKKGEFDEKTNYCRTLPAGEYRIERFSAEMEGIQLIRQSDGKISTLVTTLPSESKDKTAPARLVFYRYGNEYFLSEIWTDGTHGRHLHKSALEKEMASTLRSTEVAVLAQVPSVGL